MNPYIPFAALPVAAIAAWLAASNWPAGDPSHYPIPRVTRIDNPIVPTKVSSGPAEEPDIRVRVFVPHKPPVPPDIGPTLILESVMTGKGVRLASINGHVVKEGGRVEGYRVRRIGSDGVELVKDDKTRRLPMRSLHELPPPVRPSEIPGQKGAIAKRGSDDLTQDFWKIFDSLKP